VSLSQASVVLAGRYRLQSRIAAGGMGEVWRGVDLVLDRPVAVKLLRDEYVQHPETLARFRAEARHAAAVPHRGIAQVYDYDEAGPGQPPFLVMELVDGPSLTQVLARGPLDPARAMDVVAQAAAGLGAAHAAGLVHRDIKPGNLLICPDGTVKITDFGIAYAAGSAPLTRTGALIGTPAYLAPERVTGGPAGPASDLYSLGIVAYECLAGAPPFAGTPMEVALAHQHQSPPALPGSVPLPVAALVAELTARDPALRPGSADEVAARAGRLRDALGGEARVDPWLGSRAGAAAAGEAAVRAGAIPAAWAGTPPGTPGDASAATLLDAGPDGAGPYAGPYGAGPYGAGPYGAGMDATAMPGTRAYEQRWPPRPRRGAPRPARGRRPLLLLTAAAVAVIVGLAGWMVASASGTPSSPQQPSTHRSRPTTAAGLTVEVNSAALVGQQADDVARQLRDLGLRVREVFVPDNSDPGTVLSVQPGGRVRIGTTVVVTAAGKTDGHHHHHDGGDGNNGGN
jgi:tRNA A-37 threonylcarbamoyl transferase component Bud32